MSEQHSTGKKVVIIGAGIGGLSAAVYSARAGFDTEVYEQHSIAGGECTGWDRNGYHIDNCIHWLVGTTQGTDLYRLWETVGVVGDGVQIRRSERMYVSELNGEQVSLWTDIDRTEKELITLSPQDSAEICSLMKLCRLAQKVFIPAKKAPELMNIRETLSLLLSSGAIVKINRAYQGMNIADLAKRFKHPLIRRLISDFTPADSAARSFAISYGNFASGDGGIPFGGSRMAAQRMKKTAERYGAQFHFGTAVNRIEIDSNRATAIILDDKSRVTCDYIIPACDTSVTFGKLLDIKYREPLLSEMYQNRKAYPVYASFQTALAAPSIPECELESADTDYIIDCPDLVFTPGVGNRLTVKSYGYETAFAPPGKHLIQTLQGGSETVFDFWDALYKTPQAYRQKKQEIADLTRLAVEKRFPQYSGKLTTLDVWTPMTYVRYCSAYKGFYQSFTVSKDSVKLPYPSAYVKGLDNIILAGQWLVPPGGLPGAAITGKYAIQRMCHKEGIQWKE